MNKIGAARRMGARITIQTELTPRGCNVFAGRTSDAALFTELKLGVVPGVA